MAAKQPNILILGDQPRALLYGAQAIVAAQIENYVKYPPRQKAASFNLDSVMEELAPAIKAEKARAAAAAKESAGKAA